MTEAQARKVLSHIESIEDSELCDLLLFAVSRSAVFEEIEQRLIALEEEVKNAKCTS